MLEVCLSGGTVECRSFPCNNFKTKFMINASLFEFFDLDALKDQYL